MIDLIALNKDDNVHKKYLFELLKNKTHEISHSKMPTYDEHLEFVINYPYRFWYIIKKSNSFIGSVYLTNENTIGLNLNSPNKKDYIATIKLITNIHKPLPPKKSVRSKYFQINANPNNDLLIKAIKSIEMIHIQNTYILK